MRNKESKSVLIDSFKSDPRLQCRIDLDEDGIDRMAEAYRDGEELPPVEAVFDAAKMEYYLHDGHRRCKAARKAGLKSIMCVLTNGTFRDAQLLAIAANQQHDKVGRSRTNADKRRAVERLMSDSEWCRWSDSKIAEYVGVSHGLVGQVRRELQEVAGSPASEAKGEPRTGADGRMRKPPVKTAPVEEPAETFEANEFLEETDTTVSEPQEEDIDYGEVVNSEPPSEETYSWQSDEPNIGGEYEPELGDAYEPAEGVDPDIAKQCKVTAKEWNAKIKAHIQRFEDLLKLEPDGPWLDETTKKTVRQCLNQMFGAYKVTMYYSEPCPKCKGYGNFGGKMCEKCRAEGVMPKKNFDMIAATA